MNHYAHSTITIDRNNQAFTEVIQRGYFRQTKSREDDKPTPPATVRRNRILLGDALAQLQKLPTASIDTAVTSPPYYMLRNYGVSGQLGLEANVDEWVDNLVAVFSELARVLKPSGSLWLNLGDSFSRHDKYGAPPKGLLCAPERLLIALATSGWIVRNKVAWIKPNPLPSSVTDRLTLSYEPVYLMVRSPHYYFDLNAIREPHRSTGYRSAGPVITEKPIWAGPLAGTQSGLRKVRIGDQPGHELGKNPGDVWRIPTRGFRGAHFATFPPDLARRPILATCPEAVCTRCGAAWLREVTVRRIPISPVTKAPRPSDKSVFRFKDFWNTVRQVGDLIPCGCDVPTVPGVVIDPFMGAGTVGLVAEQLGRDWIGIEINPEYRKLALKRIATARGTP